MKPTLQPGIAAENTITVDRDRTISFMGDAGRVYATPVLVRDIEHTCRDLLLQHLDAGEDSVGTRVEIDHVGATPLGMKVTLAVKAVAVDGRSVTFEVEGRDAIDAVVRGRHTRFVVDTAKTMQRLAAKVEKARALGAI